MSAVISLWQRDAAHLLVDGLAYDADGVIGAVEQKCHAFPIAEFAVTSMGPVGPTRSFKESLETLFPHFDDLVEGIEAAAPAIFDEVKNETSYQSPAAQFVFAGWSRKRNRPEIHALTMFDVEEAEEWATKGEEAFKLRPVDMLGCNPAFTPEAIKAVGFTADNMDSSRPDWIERIDPRVDLLLLLEALRRTKGARFGKVERHLVGGVALLTTVTRRGITQEVLHRWTEDKVGEFVTPLPFDAKRWRAEHPKVRPAAPSEGYAVAAVPSPAFAGAVADAAPIGGLSRQQRRAQARAGR